MFLTVNVDLNYHQKRGHNIQLFEQRLLLSQSKLGRQRWEFLIGNKNKVKKQENKLQDCDAREVQQMYVMYVYLA